MGPIEWKTFWLMLMLNAMQSELQDVQSHVMSGMSNSDNYPPEKCVSHLAWETKRMAEQTRSSGTASGPSQDAQVLIANAGRQKTASKKFCSNCKQTGHLADTCFGPGGAMEGKRDEVLARKRTERDARKTKTPSTSSTSASLVQKLTDSNGRAFIVDNGTVLYVNNSAPAPAPAVALPPPSAEFTGLLAEPANAPSWATSLPPADHFEVFYTSGANASVDWSRFSTYTGDYCVFPVAPHQSSSHLPQHDTAFPFIMDSGATTHISPSASDFVHVRPITPFPIRGFGSASVPAVGIGQVNLLLGNGKTLHLDNVLLVPGSSVRLVSVSAICDGARKPLVTFGEHRVYITNALGNVIASGSRLPQRCLYALEGSPAPPPSVFAAFTPAVPSTDTWHRRLGHPAM